MILELGPHASTGARIGAALVLSLHVTAGGVGLLSGAGALFFRKGSRWHRRAGNWFVVSMLIMSGIGAAVAPLLPQRFSVVPAVLTFYLVSTGWMAAKRAEGAVGAFEVGAMLVAFAAAALGIAFGLLASNSPGGRLDGASASNYFTFAAFAAGAGLLDLRMILRGGANDAQRRARHIWRMCIALLIAALSLFLGQQQVFPKFLRGSLVLLVPEIAILAAMSFWLFRIRRGAPARRAIRRSA